MPWKKYANSRYAGSDGILPKQAEFTTVCCRRCRRVAGAMAGRLFEIQWF
jgi:hypothetical protein